jgi:hypothetical protein
VSVLALSLSLNACQSQTPGHAESSAASPSSTVSAPDTVAVVRYEYRDAEGRFNPDGYYLPEDSLLVEQWSLRELELNSIEYYFGGEFHYERPRVLIPPQARLVFTNVTTDHVSAHTCPSVVAPDTLSIRCFVPKVGDVQIDGHFDDKTGWSTGKGTLPAPDAILLIARVIVRRNGTVIYDHVHGFTFTLGD